MNDVLRPVSLVGLRDEASAAIEEIDDRNWEFGKGTDRQMAN
jgi:hypothetical protein